MIEIPYPHKRGELSFLPVAGVSVIVRDRSGPDTNGTMRGALDVMQVPGRFHILQNLSEAPEMVFNARTEGLRTVARSHAADCGGQGGAG
jgi:hypothetical protein